VQALLGDDITIYGTARRREASATSTICRSHDRLMATDDDFTGPINIGNPGEFTIHDLAAVLQLTGSSMRARLQAAAHDDPKQRQPDIGLARRVLRWSRSCGWRKASKEQSRIFATAY